MQELPWYLRAANTSLTLLKNFTTRLGDYWQKPRVSLLVCFIGLPKVNDSVDCAFLKGPPQVVVKFSWNKHFFATPREFSSQRVSKRVRHRFNIWFSLSACSCGGGISLANQISNALGISSSYSDSAPRGKTIEHRNTLFPWNTCLGLPTTEYCPLKSVSNLKIISIEQYWHM